MKKVTALVLILLLSITLFIGCNKSSPEEHESISDNKLQQETSVQESTPTPTPDPIPPEEPEYEDEEDSNRVQWNGFSVALVDDWYKESDGFQAINLKQESDAFDKPDLLVRYLGHSKNYGPAAFIEQESAKDWVQELGEINWMDNVTANGIEYMMAEYSGSRYKMFWLFAMEGTLDKNLDTNDTSYLVMHFDWIDLESAMPLLETVEIDWSLTP